MQTTGKTQTTRRSDSARQGVATLWVIVAVPVLLTLLIVVSDVANLRLARIEAENAVEAAALAAVKQWHEGGDSAPNRRRARAAADRYAAANTVVGQAVAIGRNDGTADVNDNASTDGNIVLGKITGGGAFFDHSSSPNPGEFGVHVQEKVSVSSLFSSFGGFSYGPYKVFVQATALYDGAGEVRLVRVQTFTP